MQQTGALQAAEIGLFFEHVSDKLQDLFALPGLAQPALPTRLSPILSIARFRARRPNASTRSHRVKMKSITIHVVLGHRAGTICLELAGTPIGQQGLSHDAASRIAGADEEQVLGFFRHRAGLGSRIGNASSRGYKQQTLADRT
jgi:hypothetical protein